MASSSSIGAGALLLLPLVLLQASRPTASNGNEHVNPGLESNDAPVKPPASDVATVEPTASDGIEHQTVETPASNVAPVRPTAGNENENQTIEPTVSSAAPASNDAASNDVDMPASNDVETPASNDVPFEPPASSDAPVDLDGGQSETLLRSMASLLNPTDGDMKKTLTEADQRINDVLTTAKKWSEDSSEGLMQGEKKLVEETHRARHSLKQDHDRIHKVVEKHFTDNIGPYMLDIDSP